MKGDIIIDFLLGRDAMMLSDVVMLNDVVMFDGVWIVHGNGDAILHICDIAYITYPFLIKSRFAILLALILLQISSSSSQVIVGGLCKPSMCPFYSENNTHGVKRPVS